jgi:phenylpropionate dioxygenase-like ring-hydroxylating dioxygenase large terminal subunit
MIQDPVLRREWLPAADLSELDPSKPFGFRLLGVDLVLVHLETGWECWLDLCVHRGTKLSLGTLEAGRLTCPYHGWAYGSGGACVHIPAHPDQAIPAKARTPSLPVRVSSNLVWVAFEQSDPDSSRHDPPELPEWTDSSFKKIPCGPFTVRASAPRVVENFLDVAHFAFVHEGYLGSRDHPEIPDYTVEHTPAGITSRDINVYQPNPDGDGVGRWVNYTYTVFRPLVAYFRKNSGEKTLLVVTPVGELETTARFVLAMNYAHDTPDAERQAFQETIFSQDKPILESQRPELLPLDLQAELHLRSDRMAIAYRKWLNELGLSFGTA